MFGVLAWCCLAEWIKNRHTGGAGCNGWWGAAMTMAMVMAMTMQAGYHDRMGLLAFGIIARRAEECSWFPQHVHPRAFTPRSAASRIGGTTDGAAKSLGSETQPACA